MYKVLWALRALAYSIVFDRVGLGSYLGRPIFIKGAQRIRMGPKVRIMPGARMEVHGNGQLIIQGNASIGNHLHIACADRLVIEEGALISSFVLITDIDHVYSDVGAPVFDQGIRIKRTIVKRNSFIGTGAKILAGSVVGESSVVGANSVVRGDVPDFCVVSGNPAKIIRVFDASLGRWASPNVGGSKNGVNS